MDLDGKDVDILIEALDAWVRDVEAGLQIGALFTSLIIPDDKKAKEALEQREAELKKKKKKRERIATQLKARLYDHAELTEAQA